MRPLLLVSLIACAALSGCTKRRVAVSPPPTPPTSNTLTSGTVIRGGGSWSHASGRTDHIFSVNLIGKRVDWTHYVSHPGSGRGNSSGSLEVGQPPAPWFIYVEAPDRLWFCDGAANLSYRKWNPGGGSSDTPIVDGSLHEGYVPVPPEVVRLLPADLQKLFPAASSKPRPSI